MLLGCGCHPYIAKESCVLESFGLQIAVRSPIASTYEAIQVGLKRKDLKIDPKKIKQKISEQMTEELVRKISYKGKKVRVKVTYEVECDSVSGEVSYGNLVDIVDVDENGRNCQFLVGTVRFRRKYSKCTYGA